MYFRRSKAQAKTPALPRNSTTCGSCKGGADLLFHQPARLNLSKEKAGWLGAIMLAVVAGVWARRMFQRRRRVR